MKIVLLTSAVLTLPLLSWSGVSATEPVTITFSEAGYEPEEVTVEIGTMVRFVNDSSDDFWPAVDNHPTHTLYDGSTLTEHCKGRQSAFDACIPIASGQTWSFTFSKVGTFPYHDHLWSHLGGTIVVGEATRSSYLDSFLWAIRYVYDSVRYSFFTKPPAETPVASVTDRFVQQVAEADPSAAIALLMAESSSSSEIYAQCHEILHEIGQAAYMQYGSLEAATVFKNDFCNSGYVHGVFEAYFQTTTDPLYGLEEACSSYADTGREFDRWECRHGIGHGFMYYTGGDLDQSLELCESGFNDIDDTKDCYNGVFMEVFNQEVLAKETSLIQKDDPLQLCAGAPVGKRACYHYIPTYLAQTLNMEYIDMFTYCETAPEQYVSNCKSGIASEAMKRSMHEPEKVLALCEQLELLQDRSSCVVGAVGVYIYQTGEVAGSEWLCNELAGNNRLVCTKVIEVRGPEFAETI